MRSVQLILFSFLFIFQINAEEMTKAELTLLEKVKLQNRELEKEKAQLQRVFQEHIRGAEELERENKSLKERNTIYGYSLVSTLIIFTGVFYVITSRLRQYKKQLRPIS